MRSFAWYIYEKEALYHYFEENNLQKTKQAFYTCGRIDEYQIKKYDKYFLKNEIGIKHLTYALLCDNHSLIERYGQLACSKLPQYASYGSITFGMRCMIREDQRNLEEQIAIFKSKHLPFKTKKWVEQDVRFFEAYLATNKVLMEEAINTMLSKRMHNKRNREYTISREYISVPALTYAKLAWLKGFEVAIDHPLVPKDFLPVQPLDTYREEYDFFKEVDS